MTPNYTLTGRILFNAIYAVLQVFISAISAWIAARFLASRLAYAAKRQAVATLRLLRGLLWSLCRVLGRTVATPARGLWRGLSDVASSARDAAIRSRLGLSVVQGGRA